MVTLNSEIKARLIGAGVSLVGFADISDLSADVRGSLKYGISIAIKLDASIINEIGNGPTKRYYEEYKRVNEFLAHLSETTVEYLKGRGKRAVAIKPTVGAGELDKKILETALPHKTVATCAGLGWIGKSALLITKEYGPAVRLATVLTDAEFETGEAVNDSRCGECQKCVEGCPGGAIKGANWVAGTQRKDIYDALVCCKKAKELAAKVGVDAVICGICINVCPWTQKYISRELTN
jgi:epoxyqueuosine reductase QueG